MATNTNGSTTAVFAVTLSVPLEKEIAVHWQTEDGTGKAGVDYEAASGTVLFAPGEVTKAIEVVVYGRDPDDASAGNRTFKIRVTPPADAILGTALTECTIVVTDDEGTPVTSVQVATGPKGDRGKPGLSAYELAKLQGYEGTLAEWMDDIASASQAADRAEAALDGVDEAISLATAQVIETATVQANIATQSAASADQDAERAESAADRAETAHTLGTPYQTVALAQADIDNGTIPLNSFFNVRGSGLHYVDEYQNVAGVATPTGASYPSSDAIKQILAFINSVPMTNRGVIRDEFGHIFFKWLQDGGFGSANAFMGKEIIKNNIVEITSNSSGTVVFKDPFGHVFPITGTNSGNSPEPEEVSIPVRDMQNKLLADSLRYEIPHDIASLNYDYNVVVSFSQSIETGYECWPRLTKVAEEVGNLIMLGQSVRGQSREGTYAPLGGSVWNDLVSVVQTTGNPALAMTDAEVAALPHPSNNEGEEILVGAVNFWRKQQLRMRGLTSDPSRKIVALNVGVNGRTIEQLRDFHFQNRVVKGFNDIKAAVPAGKTVGLVAIVYGGNEYNYDAARGGTTDEIQFASILRTILNNTAEAARSVFGTSQNERPACLTIQPGALFTRDVTNMSIGNAHIKLNDENDDIFLVGGYYFLPDKGGHLMTNGSRWLSQFVGKVLHQVVDRRQNWFPMKPIRATCKSTTLYVDLLVPRSKGQFKPSYYLTTGGVTYPFKGLRMTDSQGTVNIVDVTYVADTVIKVQLDRAPDSAALLWYAPQTTYNGNGNICDSDNTLSMYKYEYIAGSGMYPEENIAELVDKPYDLSNFCVAFQIPVELV